MLHNNDMININNLDAMGKKNKESIKCIVFFNNKFERKPFELNYSINYTIYICTYTLYVYAHV